MDAPHPKQVVEWFIEARNAHDRSRAARLLTDDVEWHVPRSAGSPLKATEAINALVGGLEGRLFQPSSVQRRVKRIVSDGDVVIVEHTVTGTTVSGVEYVNDYCWVYELRGGLIARITSYSDTLGSTRAFGEDRLAEGLAEIRRQ